MYKTNLKNQGKNRNETMNLLYHINGKNSSYKLTQTIKTFKSQKPQVKSSRVDTSASYLKKQSKSIESQSRRGGQSHKSVRKVSQQTFSKNVQQSLQSRLKSIYNIFYFKEGKSNRKDVEEILLDSHNKFDEFFGFMDERKMRMIQDELDLLLQEIVKNFQSIMGTLVERVIEEQTQKFLDMRLALQKIASGYENEIKKLKKKNQKLLEDLGGHIEQLMSRSLVTTETISYIHREGVMNFEDWVKSALGIYKYEEEDQNYEQKRANEQNMQQDKIKKYIYYQK